MLILLDHFISGAARAQGLTVVIDVFRAATTAACAFSVGAGRILAVAELEKARALKAAHPDWLLMGERDCVPPPDFDLGNSPTRVLEADIAGRTLIQTTSAGTQGLLAALGPADEVVYGSFVTLSAVCRHIRATEPERVHLVCLGTAGKSRSAEDELCGMYMKNDLEEFPNQFEAIKRHLATIESAAKFFDPALDYAPEEDFGICTELDRFDFMVRAEAADAAEVGAEGVAELRKIAVPSEAEV